jgi:hypothetical protein
LEYIIVWVPRLRFVAGGRGSHRRDRDTRPAHCRPRFHDPNTEQFAAGVKLQSSNRISSKNTSKRLLCGPAMLPALRGWVSSCFAGARAPHSLWLRVRYPACGRAPHGAWLPAGGNADLPRFFNSLINRRFKPQLAPAHRAIPCTPKASCMWWNGLGRLLGARSLLSHGKICVGSGR